MTPEAKTGTFHAGLLGLTGTVATAQVACPLAGQRNREQVLTGVWWDWCHVGSPGSQPVPAELKWL